MEVTPLIPALRRQRQADLRVQGQCSLQSELQDSQGYIERPCLKKLKKKLFYLNVLLIYSLTISYICPSPPSPSSLHSSSLLFINILFFFFFFFFSSPLPIPFSLHLFFFFFLLFFFPSFFFFFFFFVFFETGFLNYAALTVPESLWRLIYGIY